MYTHSSEDVMDDHYGMITRAQATAVVEAGKDLPVPDGKRDRTTVSAINELISMHKGGGGSDPSGTLVFDVEDRVYRVFNMQRQDGAGKRPRTLVLGSEGNTVTLSLFDRLAESIDTDCVERGDAVLVRNALVDVQNGSLRSTNGTLISRLARSRTGITDFSLLKEGQRNIDVSGKVVEIGPIRYVSTLNRAGKMAVSDCTVSDGSSSMVVSMWGTSALATSSISINSTVRIEFCSVRRRNDIVELYAGDLSRVLVTKRA